MEGADELSRASDDAFNILFPVLDHRREIHIEEQDGSSRVVKVADGVRFIATANIGMEYSSTRSLDRALQDRFMTFNLPYITGDEMVGFIKDTQEMQAQAQQHWHQCSKKRRQQRHQSRRRRQLCVDANLRAKPHGCKDTWL